MHVHTSYILRWPYPHMGGHVHTSEVAIPIHMHTLPHTTNTDIHTHIQTHTHHLKCIPTHFMVASASIWHLTCRCVV